MGSQKRQHVQIQTGDGLFLKATEYVPDSPANQVAPTCVIASALGVRRSLYHRFAKDLCARGTRVICFDYRGIAASGAERGPAKGALTTWSTQDLPAVIAYAQKTAPGGSVSVVGHSVGGIVAALSPSLKEVDGLLAVATPSLDPKDWPGLRGLGLRMLWLLAPLLTFFVRPCWFGLALKRETLRSLVRKEQRLVAQRGARNLTSSFQGAVAILSFEHDGFAPRQAVTAYSSWFASVCRSRLHIGVGEQAGQFGHIGFFLNPHRSTWRAVSRWLRDAAPARSLDDNKPRGMACPRPLLVPVPSRPPQPALQPARQPAPQPAQQRRPRAATGQYRGASAPEKSAFGRLHLANEGEAPAVRRRQ